MMDSKQILTDTELEKVSGGTAGDTRTEGNNILTLQYCSKCHKLTSWHVVVYTDGYHDTVVREYDICDICDE